MSDLEEKGNFDEIEKKTSISEEERIKQLEIKKIHFQIMTEIMGDIESNRGSFLDNLMGQNQGTKEAPLKFFLTKVISELDSAFPHTKGDGSINEKSFKIYRKKILDIYDETCGKVKEYSKGWGCIPLVREETVKFNFNKDQKGIEE